MDKYLVLKCLIFTNIIFFMTSIEIDPRQKLKNTFGKLEEELYEKHADIVNDCLNKNPNATRLEIYQAINEKIANDRRLGLDNGESLMANGPSLLWCCFVSLVLVLIIIVFRVEYEIYFEDLLATVLIFSFKPQIDINLLISDLSYKTEECSTFSNSNNPWLMHTIEYCDFLSLNINYKLLFIHEHQPQMYYKYNSLISFANDNASQSSYFSWLNMKYMLDIITTSIPMLNSSSFVNGIRNGSISLNILYKKPDIDMFSIVNGIRMDINQYLVIQSLLQSKENNNELFDQIAEDIWQTMGADNHSYLHLQYFDDGYICLSFSVISQKMEIMIEFYDTLNITDDTFCIPTFDFMQYRNTSYIQYYTPFIVQRIAQQLNEMPIVMDYVIIHKQQIFGIFDNDGNDEKRIFNKKSEILSSNAIAIHNEIYSNSVFIFQQLFDGEIDDNYTCNEYCTNFMLIASNLFTILKDNEIALFYGSNSLIHEFLANQYFTIEENKSRNAVIFIDILLPVINKQFQSFERFQMAFIEYIVRHMQHKWSLFQPGFAWVFCASDVYGNHSLYFMHSLRYDLHSIVDEYYAMDGVLLAIDLWSHSFYYDFIQGIKKRLKRERKKVTSDLESMLHSMDILAQYIHGIFSVIDWDIIARRWQIQCPNSVQPMNKVKDYQTQNIYEPNKEEL